MIARMLALTALFATALTGLAAAESPTLPPEVEARLRETQDQPPPG